MKPVMMKAEAIRYMRSASRKGLKYASLSTVATETASVSLTGPARQQFFSSIRSTGSIMQMPETRA